MEKYVPSKENRKRWCRGKVNNPHQFRFWRYVPSPEGYPDREPYFIFQCVNCGRTRFTADAEGTQELADTDDQDKEEKPAPRPVSLVLRVYVDAVAGDESVRRLCSHSELRSTRHLSDAELETLQSGLTEAAWKAFDTARRFDEWATFSQTKAWQRTRHQRNVKHNGGQVDIPQEAFRKIIKLGR